MDSVKGRIVDILNERRMKHPLDYPSAGSVFKNPDGYSSWKLINDAGLKGKRIGGAAISELHTNFIINIDNARSSDIISLIDHIKERVFAKFNIPLEPEVRVIGEL
jgi:UDP-N-acetylmuramate dehydrogenase